MKLKKPKKFKTIFEIYKSINYWRARANFYLLSFDFVNYNSALDREIELIKIAQSFQQLEIPFSNCYS